MRYCKNIDDAKDAMQEGFVKVFTTFSRFQGNSSISTWMTRIMINTAIDHFRKSNKYTIFERLDNIESDDDNNFGEETLDDDGISLSQGQLLELIQRLPPGYQLVFNLYAIEGYSHKEIAGQLGISEGTSKSQLARARKQLQQWVTELKRKQALSE